MEDEPMWICLNKAFLSIVDKDCAPDELLVRARRDGDIERVFPDAKVEVTLGNDYRCRARIKREQVAQALAAEVMGIDYANFKGSTRERALHDAYMDAWGAFGQLQPGGPYSTGLRRRKG